MKEITPKLTMLIAGSRDFTDYELMCKVLNKLAATSEIDRVITGAARGADTAGSRWAKEHRVELVEIPADWYSQGNRAGYIRNEVMVKLSEVVVCFWDGKSNGTKHTINLTKKYNKLCYVYLYNEDKLCTLNESE